MLGLPSLGGPLLAVNSRLPAGVEKALDVTSILNCLHFHHDFLSSIPPVPAYQSDP